MTNTIWSYDGEVFQYENLRELLDNYADGIAIGDTVYVAEKHKPKVARLIDVEALLEQMNEWSYDTHGCEEADKWPDLSTGETNELERIIAEYVEKVSPPNFWVCRNVREIVITAEDIG